MVVRKRESHLLRKLGPTIVAVLVLLASSVGLRGQAAKDAKAAAAESPGQAHPASTSHPPAHPSTPSQPGASALAQSARASLRRGDFAGAVNGYKRALELDANNPELKLALARALSLSGRHAESQRLYQEVLTKSPNDSDALEGLGYAFLRSNHPAEARAVFERLVARNPAIPAFQIDLARVETRLGRYRHADQILSAVLTLHPLQREARLQLAYVKLYQHRYAAALADFTHILETDPTDFEALLGNARVFYFRGDVAYSYRLANKLVQEHPNDFDAVFLLANLERAQGHRQQAIELLDRASRLSPGNSEPGDVAKAMGLEQQASFHASASYARESTAGNSLPDLIGFAGQDLRRFGYNSTFDFSALPRSRSSISFDALPVTSPGTTGGAVVPSEFMYRQTTPVYANLMARGGVGMVRFGPGGLQEIPNQSNPVSVATTRPLGFIGASYALRSDFNLDLAASRAAVPYTPLSVRMGVMESRLEGGLRFAFDAQTEFRANLYVARYSSIRFQQLDLQGSPTLVPGATVRQPADGASVTLVRKVVRLERSSLDVGYAGRAFSFSGSPQKYYMGFFNPTFYQVHQGTARLYGTFRGPLGYDVSGGLGVQQVETHQPLTKALNLSPTLSYKVNPRLSVKLGYLYYNYAQTLGMVRGNGVVFSTDSKF